MLILVFLVNFLTTNAQSQLFDGMFILKDIYFVQFCMHDSQHKNSMTTKIKIEIDISSFVFKIILSPKHDFFNQKKNRMPSNCEIEKNTAS